MAQFIAEQGDFILSLSLFAFMLCALDSVMLNREEGRERRWLSNFSFYLFEGLAVLLLLVASNARPFVALLTSLLRALAFGSLFAFMFGASASRNRRWGTVALTLLLIAGCGAAGLVFGAATFTALLFFVVGVPGVVFAARHFLSDLKAREPGRPWLVSHVVTFVMYGLIALLQAVDALFFGGAAEDTFLIARVVLSILLGVSLSLHEWRAFGRLNRGFGRPTTRAVVYGLFLTLPAILVVAWLLSTSLGRFAQGKLGGEYQTQADLLWSSTASKTTEVDRASAIISVSPSTISFLAHPGDSSRAFAEAELDGIAQQMPGTTCYLLGLDGTAVATSNRYAPTSFVGRRFADMPGSVDLSTGHLSRFFALGQRSGHRGYYASSPVTTEQGGFLGWAVIKQDVESLLLQSTSLTNVFLVDQNGIVFLSTIEGYSYRALWPVPEERQALLVSWGQFGPLSFTPVLAAEPLNASVVTWNRSRVIVTRSYLYLPGWSIIHLGSMDEVRQYRLGGLLVAVLVAFLLAGFSSAGQVFLLDHARVERSEALYRTLVEGSPSWISVVDSSGAFLFTNRAGWRSLGTGGDGLPERRVESILGPENVKWISGHVEAALRGGAVAFETVLPSASGKAKTWNITLVPLRAADRDPTAILIGDDVTGMRRAEARLVRAERMAALGTLPGGIAHQFNNINAVAMGYIQVLEMELNLPERTKSYLRSIREAIERSVEITSRLLTLSVSPDVRDTPLLLADEVRAAIGGLQGDLGREGVAVELDLKEGLTVTINREQLVFILNALLVNAWHAVLGQPVRRIRVVSGRTDAELFLAVEDSGIGIAKDKLSSIFTPFFTLKGEHAQPQSVQARVRGVGLSLAVLHSIVIGKAGWIDVESTPGVGSTFTVWLPLPAEGQP